MHVTPAGVAAGAAHPALRLALGEVSDILLASQRVFPEGSGAKRLVVFEHPSILPARSTM